MFHFLRKNKDPMFLLVGLGNPGEKYAQNRHNIGFMVVDELAAREQAGSFKSKQNAMVAEVCLGSQKVMLAKPMTFMNESGQAVGKLARFYKIPPEKIIVFHDELDIPYGAVKVKQGGGHGGHNGLRSIDAHLGTRDYLRVRCGIGHPGDKNRVSGYVLSDFSKEEQQTLPDWIDDLARYAELLVAGQHVEYMQKVKQI
jgi:PTH1 family peptidyl-tRNA hydrolase